MVYAVTYTAKNKLTAFLPNFYDGMARHATKSDAQHTLRGCADRYPEAKVIRFSNMAEAGIWLGMTNETERKKLNGVEA